ncbi:MAG: YgjV family protein [Tetragenococcus halophilus]|nr:YgjV family protein [Tetragenococcus halophilus]
MSYEIIGTTASFVVLASFLMNEEGKIRVVNIFGAALFVFYGVLIGAFSVWVLNAILIVVHVYKLVRYFKE